MILSALDISGTNIRSTIISSISSGDVLRISNAGGSKTVAFAANNDPIPIGEDRVMIQINSESITFSSTTGEGFVDGETITLVNTSASTGLAEDVDWNDFRYYHDHADDGTEYCPPGGRHHFDFDYWNAGGLAGLNCDIFSCPDQIYTSEYVYMQRLFYPYSGPSVIYVKGGQVLVGVVLEDSTLSLLMTIPNTVDMTI